MAVFAISAKNMPVDFSETDSIAATIQVSGEAKISLPANELSINLGVRGEGNDAAALMKSTRTKMATLVAILKDRKDVKALRTEKIDLNPRYNSRSNDDYFVAGQGLRFTLTDIDAYDALLVELLDAGANTVYGVQLSNSNTEAAYDGLLEQALINARLKAERMAKAYGQTIGKAVYISDTQVDNTSRSYNKLYKLPGEIAQMETSIVGGNLELSRQVYVIFELN
jgi:hypothetical protein